MKENKFKNYLLLIFFLLIISFPLINEKTKIIKDIISTENREKASKPKFNIKKLDKFPDKFDKYYIDNFNIRSLMIRYFNRMNIMVFKKSPFPEKAIIGKDGWLFIAGNELDAYRGKKIFTETELVTFKKELEYRTLYLKERNCKFYFVIAPAKANIYSEMLPDNIYKANKQSSGEQLNEYLKSKSSVNVINIYETLRNKKNEDFLYYKIDNHWNEFGAFHAANGILEYIKKDFPDIKTNNLNDFTISKSTLKTGNIVSMFSDTTLFSDIYYNLKPKLGFNAKHKNPVGYPCVPNFPYPWEYELNKEIKDSKNPKVLIISDSFGGNIYPFLAEQFSRTVKIFDSWQFKLNEDIVNNEKPNIVLVIGLEANIKNILDYQSNKNSNQP